MPNALLKSAQYELGAKGKVTLVVDLPLMRLVLDATQEDLFALLPDGSPPGAAWDDPQAVLAAQTILDERFPDAGYVVVSPEDDAP